MTEHRHTNSSTGGTSPQLSQHKHEPSHRYSTGKECNASGSVTTPPRPSGIHQILCIPTGKIYIGSAVDLRARWGTHRWSLRRGTHHNFHLQHAWDKHGETNFEFSVLELVGTSDLLRTEQAWIDRTGCAARESGFNISNVAGSPGGIHAQEWKGFINPGGNEATIINLQKFCREHGLDFPSMHRLAMGKSKLKSYKGWTHRNSVRQREYIKTYDGFITPGGRPAGSITNLAAFCREHELDKTHMVAVAHGRICSHRGWTYATGKRKLAPRTYTGFINPGGQRMLITNLQAFCREHGLDIVHIHEIKSGQRKSHKGWTWREG
ncbi:MAG: GIY-YIG nuclease family protein [Pyrinomonadaceae bacterium]|nr:GIY-YIG nuclease family protein [Pyrinomonadaceae bacterium]